MSTGQKLTPTFVVLRGPPVKCMEGMVMEEGRGHRGEKLFGPIIVARCSIIRGRERTFQALERLRGFWVNCRDVGPSPTTAE